MALSVYRAPYRPADYTVAGEAPAVRRPQHLNQATCWWTMRHLFLTLFIALLPLPARAQSLEATDRGYVYRRGNEYVRFDRGKWSAGIEGKAEVAWHMFLWHDRWIYETLSGGKIAAGPTLGDDGSLFFLCGCER